MVEISGYKQAIVNTVPQNKIEGKNNFQSQPSLPAFKAGVLNFSAPYSQNEISINTKLTSQKDIEMYNAVSKILTVSNAEKISPKDNVSRLKKLDTLLKNGILLNNKSNDNSTTLENLYNIATKQRKGSFDNAKILGQTIDALYKPEIITQVFGDLPPQVKTKILKDPNLEKEIKENPELLDVDYSGTCVSACFEYHLARKHPAEFTRWIEGLTSPKEAVEQKIKSSSLNASYLEAYNILRNMFEIKPHHIDFNSQEFNFTLKPAENAHIRAEIQDKYWDNGERNIIDVYMQSTFMQMGSEGTYNALIDKRAGKFNSNPEGLSEFEKIFIESVIEDNERLSVVYQKVDADQNLIGWGCDLNTIQNHIINAVNSGEDVIVGYVLTNETSGNTLEPGYINTPDNRPEKIVNGHEITIVDYKQDKNGNITFICNDTDDGIDELIEYPASYLLPKIHHAGYPAQIVEQDYDRIANNIYSTNA